MNDKRYDLMIGHNSQQRIAQWKTESEVAAWCAENNYVWLRNADRQIGLVLHEATVVPEYVYNLRADLH